MLPVELPQTIKASEESKEGQPLQMTRFRMVFSTDSNEVPVSPYITGRNDQKDENAKVNDFEVDPPQPHYQDSCNNITLHQIQQYKGYYVEIESNHDEWLRISAFTHGHAQLGEDKLDKSFLNGVQLHNVNVMIFTDNRQVG